VPACSPQQKTSEKWPVARSSRRALYTQALIPVNIHTTGNRVFPENVAQEKWDGSGGQSVQALGRSRGGFGTKIHGSLDGLGHLVQLIVTAAQESDIGQAEALLAQLGRTVLVESEAIPARGDSLREESHQLPGLHPSGSNHGDVALHIYQLVSKRPNPERKRGDI
jgi:hypothetical protein